MEVSNGPLSFVRDTDVLEENDKCHVSGDLHQIYGDNNT